MHYVIGPVLDGIPACSVKQFAVPPFQIGICFPQFFHAIADSAANVKIILFINLLCYFAYSSFMMRNAMMAAGKPI